jgi:protein-S-isoprenylcysteine O-methyltransferase Ste14
MAILVPVWICRRYHVTLRPPGSLLEWTSVAAAVIVFMMGAALFVSTVSLFATEGKGTLAPWDPPRRFVIRGPYRFVRNPMISGVLLIIVAESLFLRSLPIGEWAGAFFVINLIYIPILEEPQLEHRFGEEYRAYKRNVRRFLPRIRPWNGTSSQG